MNRGTVMQGIDPINLLEFIGRRSKKFQATFLGEVEEMFAEYPEIKEELYPKIRKLYLDNLNDFARAVIQSIFGDIEHVIK